MFFPRPIPATCLSDSDDNKSLPDSVPSDWEKEPEYSDNKDNNNSENDYKKLEEENRKRLEEYKKRRKQNLLRQKEEIPLEKAETKQDYNNKIFDYISQLGKLFTKTIESSEWSQEVKNNMKNNFINIEKKIKSDFKPNINKKKCNKSDCDCADCGEKTNRRWTAKKFLITIPKTNAPRMEVLKYYKKQMDLKEIAVSQEHHKDGSLHLHCYMEFVAKKNIKSPKYFKLHESFEKYGNTVARIDTLGKRTKESVFNYLLKEDKETISWGFNIHMEKHGKLKLKDMASKLLEGTWTWKELIQYDPSIIFKKNMKHLVELVDENIKYLKMYHKLDYKAIYS